MLIYWFLASGCHLVAKTDLHGTVWARIYLHIELKNSISKLVLGIKDKKNVEYR